MVHAPRRPTNTPKLSFLKQIKFKFKIHKSRVKGFFTDKRRKASRISRQQDMVLTLLCTVTCVAFAPTCSEHFDHMNRMQGGVQRFSYVVDLSLLALQFLHVLSDVFPPLRIAMSGTMGIISIAQVHSIMFHWSYQSYWHLIRLSPITIVTPTN